jgi:hypothetical protein
MIKKKLYKGLGFVEALVAILVTGVASVALMSIASKTMTDTIRNEITDTMTQYAVEGAEMVQIIADKERLTGEDLFPGDAVQANSCYLMNNDVNDPSFVKDEDGVFQSYSYLEREEFKELAKLSSDDKYFRIFCRTGDIDVSGKLVVGEIVVGLVSRSATVDDGQLVYPETGTANISDYEHYTIIKL